MAEDQDQTQQEKQPAPEDGAALVPRKQTGSGSWELVLERAQTDTPPSAGPAAAPTAHSRELRQWLKALTPVGVVLFFFAYKGFQYWDASQAARTPAPVAELQTLSGVAPEEEESARLTQEVRTLLAKLEAQRLRGNWEAIAQTASAAPAPVRKHPVVDAFAALAEARSGARNVQVERHLVEAAERLRSAGTEYEDLLKELRVARAAQIAGRSLDAHLLQRNTDLLHQLLGNAVETPYEAQVRVELARRYEDVADSMMERAKGMISTDAVLVSQARVYYQQGLRWIVEPGRWLEIRPITPAAQPEVERLLARLREANRAFHGPSLPFTGSDSTTWSGRSGDPVHDHGRGGAGA